MTFQLLSRRGLFGRLFGAAASLVGGGGLAAAGSIAEPGDAVPLEGVTYYTYDERGRLISVDECCVSCNGSQATQPLPTTSWSYDHVGGWQYGAG